MLPTGSSLLSTEDEKRYGKRLGFFNFNVPLPGLTLKFNTWILHESEAFIGKASKGDVVVLYFESLATQHMKASGSPNG